jgi:hypothetical protein
MFRTDTDAQIPWPKALGMLWQRIELVSQLPYFLVTVHQPESEEDAEFNTTLLFSNIQAVLGVAEEPENTFEVVRVDLLSPDYLNGSSGFKLDQLVEVWLEKQTGGQRFVLADGIRMEMEGTRSSTGPISYEKVLSLPVVLAESTSKDSLH